MPATYPPHASNMARFQRRVAMQLAPVVFPAPVSECVTEELLAWEGFGWQFGGEIKVARLVDDILRRGEKLNGTQDDTSDIGPAVGDAGRAG